MNNNKISFEQFRAARTSLGLSQRFIAQESGINRSQLALFEIGKYNLESFKLLALQLCYESLGYKFEADELPVFIAPPEIRETATQTPGIVDNWVVRRDSNKADIDGITKAIRENDELIRRLGSSPVRVSLWDGKPLTKECDNIIYAMARNYLLSRSLQGRAVFPKQRKKADKKHTEDITAAELAAKLLFRDTEQLAKTD